MCWHHVFNQAPEILKVSMFPVSTHQDTYGYNAECIWMPQYIIIEELLEGLWQNYEIRSYSQKSQRCIEGGVPVVFQTISGYFWNVQVRKTPLLIV